MTLTQLAHMYEGKTGEGARYYSTVATGYRREFLLWVIEQLNMCIKKIQEVKSMVDLDVFLEQLGFEDMNQMEESDLGYFLETIDDYDEP